MCSNRPLLRSIRMANRRWTSLCKGSTSPNRTRKWPSPSKALSPKFKSSRIHTTRHMAVCSNSNINSKHSIPRSRRPSSSHRHNTQLLSNKLDRNSISNSGSNSPSRLKPNLGSNTSSKASRNSASNSRSKASRSSASKPGNNPSRKASSSLANNLGNSPRYKLSSSSASSSAPKLKRMPSIYRYRPLT